MGVADGDAADDAGRADQGRLDGGGVVAAALADGFLDRDALPGRQIQCPALIPGGADGAHVQMAEHGALLQGGLDGVGLGKGVVGGAALHDDGDVGVDVA